MRVDEVRDRVQIAVALVTRLALLATVALAGCGTVAEAPALPEVLVVVDTDLPVPLVAGRLRIDLYAEDGAWFDTSDFGRPDRRDWPASFSVYSDDESRDRLVWVRLRAYPEGAVDTYQGERFRDVDAPFARVAPTDRPRLAHDGLDVTPTTEPSPLLTVDRLVLVRLRPGHRTRVQVLLHGACAGTMARLGPDGTPVLGDSDSCVASEKTREAVAPAAADEDLTTPTLSAAGTWLAGTCPAADPTSETVCVPGGATVLGSRENSDFLQGSTAYFDPSPPRVYGLSPFFFDREELTVGALKAVIARGYSGALPQAYEGALAQPTTADRFSGCTWSFDAAGRDDYPVTCASFRAAQAICHFRGGDLPTEAQWEHVATVAGHPYKVRFPWGQELPTCERAIWGRVPLGTSPAECPGGGGPRRLAEAQADVSLLGIRDLFGSVSEWVLDDAAAFDSNTWSSVSIVDPRAVKAGARRIVRGNSWMTGPQRTFQRFSPLDDEAYAPVGVRCAYPVKQP